MYADYSQGSSWSHLNLLTSVETGGNYYIALGSVILFIAILFHFFVLRQDDNAWLKPWVTRLKVLQKVVGIISSREGFLIIHS